MTKIGLILTSQDTFVSRCQISAVLWPNFEITVSLRSCLWTPVVLVLVVRFLKFNLFLLANTPNFQKTSKPTILLIFKKIIDYCYWDDVCTSSEVVSSGFIRTEGGERRILLLTSPMVVSCPDWFKPGHVEWEKYRSFTWMGSCWRINHGRMFAFVSAKQKWYPRSRSESSRD